MKDYISMMQKINADFRDLVGSMYDDYTYSKKIVHREQGNMSDIVHKLEIYKTSSVERQKLATIYANCARARRRHKEIIEMLNPMVRLVCNTELPKMLNGVIQDMQDAKERQQKRQYTPRGDVVNFDGADVYTDYRFEEV